jgi:hypothetical protein
MYVVIRKFSAMRSVPAAARRAESGIGQILKQSPGFVAYYVFDGGNGAGGSVTQFEDRQGEHREREGARVDSGKPLRSHRRRSRDNRR